MLDDLALSVIQELQAVVDLRRGDDGDEHRIVKRGQRVCFEVGFHHALDVARRLDVKGRSTMDKKELVDAIQKANDRATTKARA